MAVAMTVRVNHIDSYKLLRPRRGRVSSGSCLDESWGGGGERLAAGSGEYASDRALSRRQGVFDEERIACRLWSGLSCPLWVSCDGPIAPGGIEFSARLFVSPVGCRGAGCSSVPTTEGVGKRLCRVGLEAAVPFGLQQDCAEFCEHRRSPFHAQRVTRAWILFSSRA